MTEHASDTNPRTIVVPGTGLIVVEPDVATVRLGVMLVRNTAAGAREAAAAAMTAILEAVAAAGVAKRDTRTSQLSLSPVTDYKPETGPRITGYQVTNTVNLTVRELSRAGAVIDAGLAAGATSLDGLEFQLEDPTEAAMAARTVAVEDARARAQTLAGAASVKLGGVIGIVEGERPPMPYPVGVARMAMKAEMADTPVESGSQEITVSLVVTFAID